MVRPVHFRVSLPHHAMIGQSNRATGSIRKQSRSPGLDGSYAGTTPRYSVHIRALGNATIRTNKQNTPFFTVITNRRVPGQCLRCYLRPGDPFPDASNCLAGCGLLPGCARPAMRLRSIMRFAHPCERILGPSLRNNCRPPAASQVPSAAAATAEAQSAEVIEGLIFPGRFLNPLSAAGRDRPATVYRADLISVRESNRAERRWRRREIQTSTLPSAAVIPRIPAAPTAVPRYRSIQ